MVFSSQENQIEIEDALGQKMLNKMKVDELDTLYHLLCADNPEKVSRKYQTFIQVM